METEIIQKKESFYFNKNKLIIILNSNYITLKVSEIKKFMHSYEIKLNLEQIKEKHIIFSKFSSLQEFHNYIKDNIDKKAIFINKIIRFEFKGDSISFELIKEKITMEK